MAINSCGDGKKIILNGRLSEGVTSLLGLIDDCTVGMIIESKRLEKGEQDSQEKRYNDEGN